jgi:ABC-type glycerol-3-phosphate transport system permease component
VMLVTSLKTTEEFRSNFASIAPPSEVTFSKFAEAWSGLQFSALMRNSIVLSLTAAVVTTAIAALGAFALARMRFRGRRLFLIGSVSLMAIPAIVIVVPLFALFSQLGLINTYPAAIVAEIGISVPFAVYLTYTFMREIPRELFLAAEVDGASWFRQLIWLALPLSRPILVTVGLVTAIYVWNDLLVPLILWQSDELRTLMVGLANLAPGRAGAVDIPLVMAGVCISVLPIVLLFIVAQRVFVRGLVEGGLK